MDVKYGLIPLVPNELATASSDIKVKIRERTSVLYGTG